MMTFDVALDVAIGFGLGLMVSTLYFTGLALGIRAAHGARRPTALLLASAALRIALLLGAGLWIARMGGGAAVGLGVAFILVRSIAIVNARPKLQAQPLQAAAETAALETGSTAVKRSADQWSAQ